MYAEPVGLGVQLYNVDQSFNNGIVEYKALPYICRMKDARLQTI